MRKRLAWERRRWRVTLDAAGTVRERARFVASELVARRTTQAYRLRESGLTALVRHPMTDLSVLREVFHLREYAPPARIETRLRQLSPVRVLDLGGHVGLFALYACGARREAKVVSLEPDARNLAVLRRCVSANRLEGRWTVVPAAAGVADGEAPFISDFTFSKLASSGAPPPWSRWIPEHLVPRHLAPVRTTVRVVDVFPHLRECDLVKMDIEGAEWDLLADPRFAHTSALGVVMEAHYEGRPEDDPPRALRGLLASAGFQVVRSASNAAWNEILWAERG
jgi:FkbM family methyltransferase